MLVIFKGLQVENNLFYDACVGKYIKILFNALFIEEENKRKINILCTEDTDSLIVCR